MSFKYFLDIASEDDLIGSSSLTKFRRLRLQDVSLLDLLIGKTVEIAPKKTLSKVKQLLCMQHIPRYVIITNRLSTSRKGKIERVKKAVEDTQEHINNSTDFDARVRHETVDISFFGYKTHLAISDERIITAVVVTTDEKSDGHYL